MFKFAVALGIVLATISSGAQAAPVITDASALSSALKNATGGEQIELAPGDYGRLEVSNRNFQTPVTISSADRDRPAHFTGVQLNGARNVRLVNLDIGRDRGTDPIWTSVVTITGGSDIALEGGSIHGSRDGDPGNDITGLKATNVANLRLSGVIIEELAVGMVVTATGLTVEDNEFRTIRSDGIDLPGSSVVRISRNRFSGFAPAAGDHPDAIQCWTKGVMACKDVVVSDNLFAAEPGKEMQGVFFGDEDSLSKIGKGYEAVTVSGNTFVNPMWNAVAFAPTVGLTIAGNVVLSQPETKMTPKLYTQGTAVVAGNQFPTYAVFGTSPGSVPPGNARSPVADKAAADKAIAEWVAKFRAPPAPVYTPVQLKVMQIEEEVRDLRELVGLPR